MPDRVVSATEANGDFLKVLRDVENGARITVTQDGKPVAVLIPADAAHSRMLDLLREGLPLGFRGGVDRDDVHSR